LNAFPNTASEQGGMGKEGKQAKIGHSKAIKKEKDRRKEHGQRERGQKEGSSAGKTTFRSCTSRGVQFLRKEGEVEENQILVGMTEKREGRTS